MGEEKKKLGEKKEVGGVVREGSTKEGDVQTRKKSNLLYLPTCEDHQIIL